MSDKSNDRSKQKKQESIELFDDVERCSLNGYISSYRFGSLGALSIGISLSSNVADKADGMTQMVSHSIEILYALEKCAIITEPNELLQ